jgi:DNA-binding NarL/FixJ family response regulator
MQAAIDSFEPQRRVSTRNSRGRRGWIARISRCGCVLLDLHDMIDPIGRAADFQEAIQLAVNHQPDVLLIDLAIPSAHFAISAITAARTKMKIVGMSTLNCSDLLLANSVLGVSIVVHKDRIRQELLQLFGHAACRREPAPGTRQNLIRTLRNSGTFCNSTSEEKR